MSLPRANWIWHSQILATWPLYLNEIRDWWIREILHFTNSPIHPDRSISTVQDTEERKVEMKRLWVPAWVQLISWPLVQCFFLMIHLHHKENGSIYIGFLWFQLISSWFFTQDAIDGHTHDLSSKVKADFGGWCQNLEVHLTRSYDRTHHLL